MTALICYALGCYRKQTGISFFIPGFFAQFPKQSFDVGKAIGVLPLSVMFVGMITFNNLCIQ